MKGGEQGMCFDYELISQNFNINLEMESGTFEDPLDEADEDSETKATEQLDFKF